MTVQRLDIERIAPQPWRNGAGLTREIARGEPASDNDFDWRISLAEVERDAPFSAFPGFDRCIVLLRGAGMRLRSREAAIDHALTEPLAPFRFPGDVPLEATLVGGACSDFNVMTRRGAIRSDVSCHRGAAEVPDADITLLLSSAGEWLVDAPTPATLGGPLQALLWRRPRRHVLAVRPVRHDRFAALLAVRLCHDRAA